LGSGHQKTTATCSIGPLRPLAPTAVPFCSPRGLAAQRVLADREQFVLDTDAQQEWERINNRPARSLPGLMRLLERPSPFGEPTANQPRA